MITLSEILEMRPNTNLCKVRIPIFEPVGNKVRVELWATMILPPGIHGGYEVGDVVFVSFTDNSLSRPVVLGQLYRGKSQGTMIDGLGKSSDKIDKASDFTCINLTAEGKVSVPAGTQIIGTYYDTLQSMAEALVNLTNKVSTLETKTQSLQAALDAAENKIAGLESQVANLQPE